MIQADAFIDERGIYVPAADVAVAADGSPSYRGRPVTRRSGKMGKSLKNGISPEEMYRRYGADTLRLYEMAMGPLEVDKPWRTDDIVGVHRFLQRLWRSLVDEQTGEPTVSDAPLDTATEHALHATIAAVRRDLGLLRFNTAIARLMELVTVAARISAAERALPRALAEPLVLLVAPLAPHIAEELWAKLGHTGSLAYEPFPEADPGDRPGRRCHGAGPGERADAVPDRGAGRLGRGRRRRRRPGARRVCAVDRRPRQRRRQQRGSHGRGPGPHREYHRAVASGS